MILVFENEAQFNLLNDTLNTAFGYPSGNTIAYGKPLKFKTGDRCLMQLEERCLPYLSEDELILKQDMLPHDYLAELFTLDISVHKLHYEDTTSRRMRWGAHVIAHFMAHVNLSLTPDDAANRVMMVAYSEIIANLEKGLLGSALLAFNEIVDPFLDTIYEDTTTVKQYFQAMIPRGI